MTLRTPRRRISPRARRRYRVIRAFFRRALGNSSQQDIKINSSIAVNVTDLKHKIVGIEHQLNEVSKHCHDIVGLENSIKRGSGQILSPECNHELSTHASQSQGMSVVPERKVTPDSTQILYKPYRKSDESEYASNTNYHVIEERKNMTLPANISPENLRRYSSKERKKKYKLEKGCSEFGGEPVAQRHRNQSAKEQFATHSNTQHTASSICSIVTGRGAAPPVEANNTEIHKRRRKHRDERDLDHNFLKESYYMENQHKRSKSENPTNHFEEKHNKSRRKKYEHREVDQEYIADIIRKQYRPTKMFGRKHSDMSQFSAPVCRDQEFTLHDKLLESPDLCSCCYDDDSHSPRISPRHSMRLRRYHDLSDVRSICDTRLYSTKQAHSRHHRRHVDMYNDSTYYDVVPVKEKSSPKSRRKFYEDQSIKYHHYKEVPPSPRTHRPRLNLKAQYLTESDEYMPTRYAKKILKEKRKCEDIETLDSDTNSEVKISRHRKQKIKLLKPVKLQTSTQIHRDNGTMSSLRYPTFANEPAPISVNENILNKSRDTDISDKTDKALCEIKDILQNFLQEIKKDASSGENLEAAKQGTKPSSSGEQAKLTERAQMPSGGAFGIAAPPCNVSTGFVQPFSNPCCYQMMPMCPMNCLASNFVVPSRSFTCPACATISTTKGTVCPDCCKQKDSNEEIREKKTETDILIKEIYKFVAQNPNATRKRSRDNLIRNEGKVLTSRSVGGTSRTSKHDAQVGTPPMRCYSKSCEAIGSRMITESSYTTQSDTILEKLSLEATTQSDTEISAELADKTKKSKFANVLRSIGLLKKKKKSREVSETESSLEVDVKPRRPPFHQEIMDYAVHAQEYYQTPPSPTYPLHRSRDIPRETRRQPQEPLCEHHNNHRHPHESRYDPRQDSHYDDRYDPHCDHCQEHRCHSYVPPPPGCEHRGPYYPPHRGMPPSHSYTAHRLHDQTIPEHSAPPHTRHRHRSPTPPYSTSYDSQFGHDLHVPYCLKEIEVKSTGTQSERKMSFLSKLGRRTPPQGTATVRSNNMPITGAGTQTVPTLAPLKPKPQVDLPKPALFSGWKKFQEKVISDINEDPVSFGYKTHKSLADGDKKMRAAMLKKFFYKRNPFSPNNLIIRTLLGNDPSSFGEPNVKLRTRMFF